MRRYQLVEPQIRSLRAADNHTYHATTLPHRIRETSANKQNLTLATLQAELLKTPWPTLPIMFAPLSLMIYTIKVKKNLKMSTNRLVSLPLPSSANAVVHLKIATPILTLTTPINHFEFD